ncbi:MAG: TonB C-terminal domain-containing protein [Pseudomonadota bacterium]|nr:TonB C-terminal domain-containing protein [Pseudomonadota bacterium]
MTLDRDTVDAAFKADLSQRLIVPRELQARRPFALILAACLTAHALLLTILLFEDFSIASEPTRAEEIPVEIVAELPPEQKALPPPPDLVNPPVVKEKPPPEKVPLDDVEVAHDAPVSGNADQTRKGETDKETKAPRVAPPPKLSAPRPAQEKPEQEKAATASSEKAANPSPPAEPQKLADDTPDAEALEKAQPEPPAKPQKRDAPQDSKSPPAQGKKVTVAQQLAALSPAPNYSFGAAAKAAPISGGTEKASYESLLKGLITRQLHLPPLVRAQHLIAVGQIGLFVDEGGNLTHQALYRASGEPALDTAWLAAVRRAAPFPAPPRGLPHGFILQYSNQN